MVGDRTTSIVRRIVIILIASAVLMSRVAAQAAGPQQAGPVTTIGPVTLRFPLEAGTLLPGQHAPGANAIALNLLLPDLEWRNERNSADFDRPGWGRKLSIFLEYPSQLTDPQENLEGRFGLLNKQVRMRDGTVVRTVEVSSDISAFKKFELATGPLLYVSRNRPDYFLICFGVGQDSSPSCEHSENIWGGVELRYEFSIGYLPSATDIDVIIHRFLDSLVLNENTQQIEGQR